MPAKKNLMQAIASGEATKGMKGPHVESIEHERVHKTPKRKGNPFAKALLKRKKY